MIVYSKKQMQPLIDKYAINPETNTVFNNIIKMFDGKPNYQLWAVKVIFSKAIAFPTLSTIKEWMDINPELIKKLSKNGNLVCYTNKEDFDLLHTEIENLNAIKFVKGMIASFNTDQRRIVLKASCADTVYSTNAMNNAEFAKWFNILKQFNMMSANTKKNVIHRISAERDENRIFTLLNMALDEKYKWNREDLLAFVAHSTPDCEVTFDDGKNIVLLRVPSYESAKKLCYGDTGWCICNSDSTFRSYSTSKGRTQFFLFDFSKRKDHELSHIGFTVDNSIGITNAHSKSDQCMINGININGKKLHINEALLNDGIKVCNFMKLKGRLPFEWGEDGLMRFIDEHKREMSVALNKKNVSVVAVTSMPFMTSMLKGVSLINFEQVDLRNKKAYLMFDNTGKLEDDNSIVMALYKKDKYGALSLDTCRNVYGFKVSSDVFDEKGILQSEFLEKEKIDPSVLLHKYIEENNSAEISKLFKNEKGIDVNYVFNGSAPIFSAIEGYMVPAIKEIINAEGFKFDSTAEYDESLLMSLILAFYLNASYDYKPHENEIRDIITTVVDSGKADLNFRDINNDTAVGLSTLERSTLWLLEKLLRNPEVDINIENDFGLDALSSAIVSHNQAAVDMILNIRKDDVKITPKTIKLAANNGINLKGKTNKDELENVFAKIFVS